MIEVLVLSLILTAMAFFAYMSSHLVSEKKAGKTIPLPWEKGGWKIFNKVKKQNARKNKKDFIE
jgi:hypothetical protein